MPGPITAFMEKNYLHFNAGTTVRAAKGYKNFVEGGGKMMIAMAGAMSTAEIGIQLAEMIRQDKVAIISCTGANLEEDVFNAVAHNYYHKVPHYRDITPQDEEELLKNHFNRVTDVCIPEEEAFRRMEGYLLPLWQKASRDKKPRFPHEFLYEILLDKEFQKQFQIPREHSWMLAAAEKNLPIVVPGWEDSSCGNIAVSRHMQGDFELDAIKGGLHYMKFMVDWYRKTSAKSRMGFFQIGGGIAGDFPICVVPLIRQDMHQEDEAGDVPVWDYFAQITDAQESYGGYSGAAPSEKITWGKLTAKSERHSITSDATIVAPLIFSYVLGQ